MSYREITPEQALAEQEARWKRLEMLSGRQYLVFKENPEDEALKQAEREFLQHLKDVSAELSEDEKNRLDAECDEALAAELKNLPK